jgi:hypothetical protein
MAGFTFRPLEVPMEKIFSFLIWIKVIPVVRSSEEGCWNLHFLSPKFFLIMIILLTADGFYFYYMVNQLLQAEQQNLSGLTILIFKVVCLNNAPAFPIILGPVALKQKNSLCRPTMSLPLLTLVSILSMTVIYTFGLAGIHFKSHIGPWNDLFHIVPSVAVTFFSTIIINLIQLVWLNDFLLSCPDGEKQELITAEESDALLEKFECLKSATNPLFLLLYPFIQLLLVFSLYNTLLGKV